MAWASYSSETLAARKKEMSRSSGIGRYTLITGVSAQTWTRTISYIEYSADGFSETGAADAIAALVADGKTAGSNRSGESGKYCVTWTEETYGTWTAP